MMRVLYYKPARSEVKRGFTLIEAALATVIIGVGVVAMMQLFNSCTRENATGTRMTTALMLAQNIRELTQTLAFNDPASGRSVFGAETGETLASYDDVDDLDGHTFSPPIDATRTAIPELAQYSQVVSIMPVYPNALRVNTNETSPDIPKTTYTGALRVRVRILYRAAPGDVPETVYTASWIRFDQ